MIRILLEKSPSLTCNTFSFCWCVFGSFLSIFSPFLHSTRVQNKDHDTCIGSVNFWISIFFFEKPVMFQLSFHQKPNFVCFVLLSSESAIKIIYFSPDEMLLWNWKGFSSFNWIFPRKEKYLDVNKKPQKRKGKSKTQIGFFLRGKEKCTKNLQHFPSDLFFSIWN